VASPVVVAACLKWADLRPEVDPLSGAVAHDARSFGWSAADEAALEWAVRLGECWRAPVVALTAGPAPATEGLRRALAVGAAAAVRVDVDADASSSSVAEGLAAALRPLADVVPGQPAPAGGAGRGDGGDVRLVACCGDWSVDRGSGSVPAFLAAELGAAQALGLVGLHAGGAVPGRLQVERRLDRGRRERLEVTAPAVVSVEGGTAHLRRASLPAVLAADSAAVTVVPGPPPPAGSGNVPRPLRQTAYRPRARILAGPDPAAPPDQRVLALTGALVERSPPRTVRAEPAEAAGIILEQLRAWGYEP
jgi:electron transfer flavoprotein beta subunit